MLISDFFIIRDEFFKHIRRKLKGIRYDLKLSTLKNSPNMFFDDFHRTSLLTEAGKKELINAAIIVIKKTQIEIANRIKFFDEQIELTQRSGEKPKKKQEYIEKQKQAINYLEFQYTPKFPSSDQNTFSRSSFDSELRFSGFKRHTETDPLVNVTVIGESVFVRLIEDKDPEKVFRTKDTVIYEEM